MIRRDHFGHTLLDLFLCALISPLLLVLAVLGAYDGIVK